ncbi:MULTISPECIES: hypothetical protein [unclassified Methylibium]|uniref:hypothetical protein n=1 Tax=unclassified Methylibium TaxID=2633235 RepID=UPI0003F46EDB|nr:MULTISPECIES: hypothetical protein [unclassified Methylibium]EWS52965.1 hypothetical protein X551_04245 [Methylibium sp. T29]EWS57557.1 hypothetical protein Y694_04460 [Methylibium sp. T29-B]
MDAQLLGLAGTALSALIAALSYRGKIRHERRRSTRTVLFYLLEVHHFLSRGVLSISTFPKQYIDRIVGLLSERGISVSEAEASCLPAQIQAALRLLMQSELTKLSAAISEPFQAALRELSRDDPVLAFDLRGKEAVSGISDLFEALGGKTIQPDMIADDIAKASALMCFLDDQMRSMAAAEVERCIRSTAWRCDLVTHYRVRRHLQKASSLRCLEEISPDVSALIVALADQIATQIRPHPSEA